MACCAMACQPRSMSPSAARGHRSAAKSASKGTRTPCEGWAEKAPKTTSSNARSNGPASSSQRRQRANCCATSQASAGAARAASSSRCPCSERLRRGACSSRSVSHSKESLAALSHAARTWSASGARELPSNVPGPTAKRCAKTAPQQSRSEQAAARQSLTLLSGRARSQKRSSGGTASNSCRTSIGRPAAETVAAGDQMPSQRSAHVRANTSCFQTAGLPRGGR
mmetsp:Transcript_27392/g.59830  ORF Transcript_27392/g.59830 Transcript_27392/m.59830 type:complete len:225 (+) Transcript_27392:2041-2715(+)